MKTLIGLTSLLLAAGCSNMQSQSGLVKALAVDQATVVSRVVTPYGHAVIIRTGRTNAIVNFNPDGSGSIQ